MMIGVDWFFTKINRNEMKNKLIIICVLAVSSIHNGLSAQENTFRFETGISYPIGLKKGSCKAQKEELTNFGLYLRGLYNFPENQLSAGLTISIERQAVFVTKNGNTSRASSFGIIPSLIYNLKKEGALMPYIELGTGVSIDNLGAGAFNQGRVYHLTVVPTIGVRMFRHINVFAKYYITHKAYSRLSVGCGYTF